MNNFLTDTQLASLVEAIQTAEDFSTGEIRIHIDSNTEIDNAEKAVEVFKNLCYNKTANRNAILIHVNFEQKYLTIIGDEGIHNHVHQSFWDKLHDETTSLFAKKQFFEGLQQAVLKTGTELKKYFPISGENPNEISNEITFS